MHGRGAIAWLVTACLCCAGLIGCVSTGLHSPPGKDGGQKGQAAATAPPRDDVPLVPLPPLLREGADKSPPVPVRARAEDPPAPVPDAKVPAVTMKELLQRAEKRYATMDSYIVRFLRRESVNGRVGADELILFKFRRAPWSVYLKWLGKEGQGREVVYVKGRYQGKIHSLLAAGDIPFVAAGKRMALAPDSVLVRTACRHPITEAGLGACIDRISTLVAAFERGDSSQGAVRQLPAVKRNEFEKPAHALEHVLPPGLDTTLPRGGRRTYFFDPESGLPMLITTSDDKGQEVEYYRYDRLQPSVKLDDDDFDPDRLWGKPKAGPAGK